MDAEADCYLKGSLKVSLGSCLAATFKSLEAADERAVSAVGEESSRCGKGGAHGKDASKTWWLQRSARSRGHMVAQKSGDLQVVDGFLSGFELWASLFGPFEVIFAR